MLAFDNNGVLAETGVRESVMPKSRSVFGVDKLWEREMEKLKEIEAQEKIDAEERRKREEEEEGEEVEEAGEPVSATPSVRGVRDDEMQVDGEQIPARPRSPEKKRAREEEGEVADDARKKQKLDDQTGLAVSTSPICSPSQMWVSRANFKLRQVRTHVREPCNVDIVE